jgi:HPt (histidine-containing phosphotransfer) domain-containing protein
MEIINTFVPGLTTFKFSSKDELERNFDMWMDAKYLHEFFTNHKENLAYFKVTSIKEAINVTLREVKQIQEELFKLTQNSNNQLDELFQNLDDNEYRKTLLSKQKSKQRWLRLYAIKIESNHYVITGGAIKLVHKMKQSELTQNEKVTIKKCRNYLLEQGVHDADSFYELIL